MPFGSLSNVLEVKSAEGFRGSSVLQQSYPLTGYTVGAAPTPPAFTPLSLFTGGVQGVWYDPSDLTTMFTDSAGTTPVGTPGNGSAQPVGKILDKSGNGNHATQSTASARPTLSARYNLLTSTQNYTVGPYGNDGSSTLANNVTTAPDGTTTAGSMTANSTSGYLYYVISGLDNARTYTFSVYLKKNTARYGVVGISLGQRYNVVVDLNNGSLVGEYNTSTPLANTGYTISDAGSGWYRIQVQGKYVSGSYANLVWIQATNTNPPTFGTGLDITNATAGTGIYTWGWDARLINNGLNIPVYQKVVDSLNYTATGFPYYLSFDGASTFMLASDSAMPTGDLSVWSGTANFDGGGQGQSIFLYGQASSGKAVALSYNNNLAINSILISTYANYGYLNNQAFKNLVTSFNRVGSAYTLRTQGGASTTSPTLTTATAVYGANGLGIGRGGAAYPQDYLKGQIYGLIIRGAASSGTEISNGETWMNTKTFAY